jgi:hypothetical protein
LICRGFWLTRYIAEGDDLIGADAMKPETEDAPAMGVVRVFPTAPNRANLTLHEVADAYMAAYTGRDPSRAGTTAFRIRELGQKHVVDVTANDIADVLDAHTTVRGHVVSCMRLAALNTVGATLEVTVGAARPRIQSTVIHRCGGVFDPLTLEIAAFQTDVE